MNDSKANRATVSALPSASTGSATPISAHQAWMRSLRLRTVGLSPWRQAISRPIRVASSKHARMPPANCQKS
jgi:hypothetical protein